MAELRPFRALRYNPDAVEVADVVAPPYDVIDDSYRDALYARSEFNVIRLILGREEDRYGVAARCWSDWQQRGALRRDPAPALYLYVQDFRLPSGEERQRAGIIGTVRLEPFSSGRIRPHERTLAAAKADRLRLISACQANLSPIFGLYPDGGAPLEEARGMADRAVPSTDITDEFEVRHRIWAIGGDLVDRLASQLASQTIFIADGHHRYETALAYRDRLAQEKPLSDDDPANFVMMFVCSMTDPGLVILPTHRVLGGLRDFDGEQFLRRLGGYFELREFPMTAQGRRSLVDTLQAKTEPGHLAVAVRGRSAAYLASLSNPSTMDREAADLVAAVRRLDVTLLDRLVMGRVLDIQAAAAAHDGRLRYVKDEGEALQFVITGAADVAFLLNATRIEEVEAVCRAGKTMPEKSTYFHPKLLTGLLFHALRERTS